MNRAQQVVLCLGLLAAAYVGYYPPTEGMPPGVWSIRDLPVARAHVDAGDLLAAWGAVAALTGAIALALHRPRR